MLPCPQLQKVPAMLPPSDSAPVSFLGKPVLPTVTLYNVRKDLNRNGLCLHSNSLLQGAGPAWYPGPGQPAASPDALTPTPPFPHPSLAVFTQLVDGKTGLPWS